jgi:lipopolysaccharide/colanic/teichoic acid biosynthesis glycosyltransferase
MGSGSDTGSEMKRLLDFFIALGAFVFLFPVFMILCIVIRYKLGSAIFFKQKRPGKNGEVFEIIKFRTMQSSTDSAGNLLPDSQRLTSFGRALRSTSLDELPGLLNVIKGDMSLVGPRPLLVEYLPLYSEEQKRRHNVRPGITGWAQVNGRNAIGWDEKFRLDVWYVDNQSLYLDVKILFLTVKKVFFREDISAEGHVTIEPFRGNVK